MIDTYVFASVSRKLFPYMFGVLLTANFLVFWALPISGMGGLWKLGLKSVLLPVYDAIDKSTWARSFAENYIYTRPQHADYFATSLLVTLNALIGLGTLFYVQLTRGHLPWWLILAYYCSWVGVGGRVMGAAYALAHKEGHNFGLYKKWFREYVGHFFENSLGMFYGTVPWNFTTSHVAIHHKLDGGVGDTFYQWDLNRSSVHDFMLYVTRIFLHMIGYSSLKYFVANGLKKQQEVLRGGVISYCCTGVIVLAITRSPSFVFWVYLQPLFCMSYFLALLNFGFHGFVEFDEAGEHIACVNATTIINGEDDYFGEDDHMAHHYNQTVYFRDLPALQASKEEEFKKYKASVFQKLSIVELSIFVLLGLWDKLAEHYVDYSGTMSKEEIMAILKRRATTTESTYEAYEKYLAEPSIENRSQLLSPSRRKSS